MLVELNNVRHYCSPFVPKLFWILLVILQIPNYDLNIIPVIELWPNDAILSGNNVAALIELLTVVIASFITVSEEVLL